VGQVVNRVVNLRPIANRPLFLVLRGGALLEFCLFSVACQVRFEKKKPEAGSREPEG
jgi:hypothetical protein